MGISGRRTLAIVWLALLMGSATAAEKPRDVAFELGPVEVMGPGPHMFAIGAGVFDWRRVGGKETYDGGPRAEARAELYSGWKLWFVAPMIGVLANHDGGVYGWAGGYIDARIGPFYGTPVLGLGAYRQGESKDLGGVFTFYTGGTISYEFENDVRLGLIISHLSNAYTHEDNPGTESFLLSIMVPFE
jgi:lipid A 3-O-deacylase